MSRVFNTAGPCLEDRHYMIPPERRLTEVRSMVEGAYYFVLFAPRQTGKTTLLPSLSRFARSLTAEGRYAAITRIANPIYAEIIPKALSSHVRMGIPDEPAWYRLPDGTLDLPKLIQGFVAFWRRHGEVLLRGMPYQEAAPHLVFMAYLQRIVNAGGRIEREFAVGTGRADLVVELGGRTDIIELKLHRGRHSLPEGLEQVARYATRLGRDRGYLVIFDPTSNTPFEERGTLEEIPQGEVTVTLLRA